MQPCLRAAARRFSNTSRIARCSGAQLWGGRPLAVAPRSSGRGVDVATEESSALATLEAPSYSTSAAQAAQLEEPVYAASAASSATTQSGGPAPEPEPHTSTHTPRAHDEEPAAAPKVADLDARRFKLHFSVQHWQDFNSTINTIFSSTSVGFTAPVEEVLRRLADSEALRDPRAAAYWAYHSARLSFFAGQAVSSLVAHHVSEMLPDSLLPRGLARGSVSVSSSSSGGSGGMTTPLTRIASNAQAELSNRVTEALATFQQDYDNIKSGSYPLPWDMTPAHRQNTPGFALRRTAAFLAEATATLRRRVRSQPDALWVGSNLYPDYYLNTYHFQTDGWMSNWSASIYEHSTEVLFLGRQDAMQRTSLLPLADFVAERQQQGVPTDQLRLLEVAAGTGRFHTFIRDAWPDMRTVCSDLSPYYLSKARENMRYWKRLRQPSRFLGGADDTGTDFLQCAVERIAAPDASFDVLVCVYLFHELPPEARHRAAAEFHRVLKPGGMVVLTDSVQKGDRPAWDRNIGAFQDFNEPYYKSYTETDLGGLFEEAGFTCDTKWQCSASKTLSFRKP